MAERPIILFGQPNTAAKAKRGGGAPVFQRPTHERQTARLAPKMAVLESAVATIKASPVGIEAEKTLVFDVIGGAESFYAAIKKLGTDTEWVFDMPQDFLTSDDFYFTKKQDETGVLVRDTEKGIIGGKVYCVMSNARAMEEMLSLWNTYKANPKAPVFSQSGKAGWRDVFDAMEDMSFWGYKQRVEETGILEAWREDLKDSELGFLRCEFELFYRISQQKRDENELRLKDTIIELGGSVLGTSIVPEIAYHAVLACVPRAVAERIVAGDENVSIVTAEQIMFFRPVGQAIIMPDANSFDSRFAMPSTEGIIDEPIIALFDGLPQENHPYLQNRITVDDPDDFAVGYVVEARKHGTSMTSMVALGDLANMKFAVTRKIYVRPIMKPVQRHDGTYIEEIPQDVLLVDMIHIAVRRLFEEPAGRVAPSVKVINLSIGIGYRQFDRAISPLARLLDWLSWRYKDPFCQGTKL